MQEARCSSTADLHQIFAANALQILLLAKWKTVGFRGEKWRFAANLLRKQRKGRAPRGVPRVSRLASRGWQRTREGADQPARHPQQRQFGAAEPRSGNRLETFST